MNVNPHLLYIQPPGQNQPAQMQQRHLQQRQLVNQHLGSANPLLAAVNGSNMMPASNPMMHLLMPQRYPGQNQNQNLQSQNLQNQNLQSQNLQSQSLQNQGLQNSLGNQGNLGNLGSLPGPHTNNQGLQGILNLAQGLGHGPSPQGQAQGQAQGHGLNMQMAPQVSVIKEVWNFNLEHEFNALRAFVNDKTSRVFLSIHQEIPGIVARPVGTFRLSSDYHFQTLRLNLDLLSLIQLSFCAVKIRGAEVSNSVIWQFNFLYDLTKEMFNEEHLLMLLLSSQINFASHMSQGIPHMAFAELLMESGLLLDPAVTWLSYHLGYDLGFLVSLLTNDILPNDENDFFWWCAKYFPSFYDLKHIGNAVLDSKARPESQADLGKATTKPSVEYLAEELHLLPISPLVRQYFTLSSLGLFLGHPNLQMTSTLHAYLLMECFKELYRQTNSDLAVFDKFKGHLWGLGDVWEGYKTVEGKKP